MACVGWRWRSSGCNIWCNGGRHVGHHGGHNVVRVTLRATWACDMKGMRGGIWRLAQQDFYGPIIRGTRRMIGHCPDVSCLLWLPLWWAQPRPFPKVKADAVERRHGPVPRSCRRWPATLTIPLLRGEVLLQSPKIHLEASHSSLCRNRLRALGLFTVTFHQP